MGGRLTPLINAIEWFISMLPWWQRVRLYEVFHNGGFIMKKKLLSIGLLLSFAAQASPVKGLFKLGGMSMNQAATTAVDHVAQATADALLEDQMAAASQAIGWRQWATNGLTNGLTVAQDGVTTFGTALVDTVKANPKTSIGLGVAGLAITAAVTYKYNDKLASLRLGAPLFGKSTTNTTAAEQVAAPKTEVKPSRWNPMNLFGESAADKAAAEQAYAKQVEEAERLAAETKAQQVANDAAIAAELQRQEEVRQVAVTRRQAAPVVTALDAEVAALRKYVTEYPVAFNADFFKHVNAANFAHFSKEARDVVFAICQ